MPIYRSEEWKRLAEGRALRVKLRASRGSHPLAHVDADKCYEWMRVDSAAHDAARQAREDGLINTITQISSGALLAIPGLIFGSDSRFPSFNASPTLYVGIILFLITLSLAMAEQLMSGKAYQRQKQIAYAYYTLQSERSDDSAFLIWLRRIRRTTYIAFGLAIVVSMWALINLERPNDGKSSSTPSTSTSAAASAAPASTPATTTSSSSTPSAAIDARLRRVRPEVGSGLDPSATTSKRLTTHRD